MASTSVKFAYNVDNWMAFAKQIIQSIITKEPIGVQIIRMTQLRKTITRGFLEQSTKITVQLRFQVLSKAW